MFFPLQLISFLLFCYQSYQVVRIHYIRKNYDLPPFKLLVSLIYLLGNSNVPKIHERQVPARPSLQAVWYKVNYKTKRLASLFMQHHSEDVDCELLISALAI